MNIKTPTQLIDSLKEHYEEIDLFEFENIAANQDYKYGDLMQIQILDPLDTCTHYNYAYFKRIDANCVKDGGENGA